MKYTPTDGNLKTIDQIINYLNSGETDKAVAQLQQFKDELYATIPEKQRISTGVTWVVQKMAQLFMQQTAGDNTIKQLALQLQKAIPHNDQLLGVAIFMMSEYGKTHLDEVTAFFTIVSDSPDWVTREFAQGGFRQLITSNKDAVIPWLTEMATCDNPNQRRFVSETLRPVTVIKWVQKEPQYSLQVLRLLFEEHHPYPRTSVGNNLSDLSRKNPDLILSIASGLAASGNSDSYWIAYRACRNLVKQYPDLVLDLLNTDTYQYKERKYHR
jgi:3-methyladenine DNA glycosylase AlkC